MRSLVIFNLDKAASRFLPIYQEQREHEKLSGAIVLIAATVLVLGLAVVLGIPKQGVPSIGLTPSTS